MQSSLSQDRQERGWNVNCNFLSYKLYNFAWNESAYCKNTFLQSIKQIASQNRVGIFIILVFAE